MFSEGQRAEFRRRDHGLRHHTEIVVSPEDDIELRRVRITNRSRSHVARIEPTSYAEVVLAASARPTMLHPAFSNLFVQTEIVYATSRQAIVCARAGRARARTTVTPWMFHLMAVHGAEVSEVAYSKPTARDSSAAAASVGAHPLALTRDAGAALGHRRIGARSDRRHPRAGSP